MTASTGKGRGGLRVFRGKKARELRAALKRLAAERERKDKPKDSSK